MHPPPRPGSGEHRPGPDGLRGVAILGVLAYHAGFEHVRGGYLGVSLFFTLSGFLITARVLREVETSGTVRPGAFWRGRVRRLAPGALATMAGIVAWTRFGAPPWSEGVVRADLLPTAAQVANWHALGTDRTYGEIFAGPSPLAHYWSLAIEEQFYVVFPLLALLGLRRARRSVAIGGVLVGIVASTWWLSRIGGVPDRWYFDTFARASELLVGVLAALCIVGRRERSLSHPAVQVAGLFATGLLLVSWTLVDRSEPLLADGGMLVHGLLATVAVLAAWGSGPASRAFSVAPLRFLGRISYAAYLVHWPVFLALRAGRQASPTSTMLVGGLVTVAVATAFTLGIEEPIRGRTPWPWATVRTSTSRARRTVLVRPAAALLATVALVAVTVRATGPGATAPIDSLTAPALAPPPTAPTAPTTTTGTPSDDGPATVAADTPTELAPRRLLLVGDSVMGQTVDAHRNALSPLGYSVEYIGGPASGPLHPQGAWTSALATWVRDWQPDVVVIEACCDYTYDKPEPYRAADGRVVVPGTPEVYDAFRQEVATMVETAAGGGATVLAVAVPPASTNGFYGPMEQHVAATNSILADLGHGVVDWAAVLAPEGTFTAAVDGTVVRHPDGVHLTDAGSDLAAQQTARVVRTLVARA